MKLHLDPIHRITTDALQFILQRQRKTKKGEMVWRNVGYYPTLLFAMRGWLRETQLRDDAAEFSLDQVEELYQRLDARLESLAKGFTEPPSAE